MPRVDDGGIHARGELRLREDDSTVGPAQGVARGERDDIGERHGRGDEFGCDETDALADVDPEVGVHGLCDLVEDLVVDRAREADRGKDDEPRPDALRLGTHCTPVDLLRAGLDAVVLKAVGESRNVIFFAQVEGEHHVALCEECLKDDARGGDDVAEADDGVVTVKELFCAVAHDGLEVEAAGRGLVAAVKEAVREDTALKILRERRHGVHVRHQRECVALSLAFFLQEVVDLGVEGFKMMDDFFAFHGQFSLKIDKERILLTFSMPTVYHNISVWSPTFDVSEYCYQGGEGDCYGGPPTAPMGTLCSAPAAPQCGWTTETAPSLLMARYVPSL